MDKADRDASVLAHIQKLVSEEHTLMEHPKGGDDGGKRLSQLQVELDQCWDLLRQRRALREFGADASKAQVRPADVVERYEG
jgi:hypothetical protein